MCQNRFKRFVSALLCMMLLCAGLPEAVAEDVIVAVTEAALDIPVEEAADLPESIDEDPVEVEEAADNVEAVDEAAVTAEDDIVADDIAETAEETVQTLANEPIETPAGAGAEGCPLDVFTDAAFREVLTEYDKDGDGALSDAEIQSITMLNCTDRGIASLAGIENLTSLLYLACGKNALTELDLTAFPDLVGLECNDNQLTSLRLANGDAMDLLICSGNRLTDLTLTNATIYWLLADDNPFESLTLTGCTLPSVSVAGCGLTTLDLSAFGGLQELDCSGNALKTLDTSANAELCRLNCSGNALTALDVSKNAALAFLDCRGNSITSLRVDKCPKLAEVAVAANKHDEADGGIGYYTEDQSSPKLYVDAGTQVITKVIPTMTLRKDTTKTMYMGAQLQLVLASGSIKACRSADTKIATVSSKGLITAVKPGKVKITVARKDRTKIVLTLTVKDPSVPDKVVIEQGSKASVKLGKTLALSATIKPATATGTVTWKSANTKIAKVAKKTGVVTPVKAGTVKITATTNNGKIATITITVIDPKVITSLKFKKSTVKATARCYTPIPEMIVKPAGATKGIKWSSSNNTVAYIYKGKIWAAGKGTAKITATLQNKRKASFKVKVVNRFCITIDGVPTNSVTMYPGDTIQLYRQASPSLNITSSMTKTSDSSVITPVGTPGLWVARGASTATLTSTASNGAKWTIKVTVKPRELKNDLDISYDALAAKLKFEIRYTGVGEYGPEYGTLPYGLIIRTSSDGRTTSLITFSGTYKPGLALFGTLPGQGLYTVRDKLLAQGWRLTGLVDGSSISSPLGPPASISNSQYATFGENPDYPGRTITVWATRYVVDVIEYDL